MVDKAKQTQFASPLELAETLGVTVRTILTWARIGMIPALRFSRRVIRFDLAQVEEALRAKALQERESQHAEIGSTK
jgi:excisionase family DNA binding protein